jgi:hypothetical protein
VQHAGHGVDGVARKAAGIREAVDAGGAQGGLFLHHFLHALDHRRGRRAGEAGVEIDNVARGDNRLPEVIEGHVCSLQVRMPRGRAYGTALASQ